MAPGTAGRATAGTELPRAKRSRSSPDRPRPSLLRGGDTGPPSDLLGPAEIRGLAVDLGVRPTKALGQNFLHDANTIRRIVRAADVGPVDVVLEVGPGLGSLTLGLLHTGARVVAVEVDPVLGGALPGIVASHQPAAAPRLAVTVADALRLTALPDPQPTALVANLPYNVAVPVVLHLLETQPTVRAGLVMVQAEVAERLAASPGSKVYGGPSAKVAWYASAQRAGAVPRAVFWPVPNVDSGLVRFLRREPPPLAAGATRADVFELIDLAFAQRRKMLRSALAPWTGGAGSAEAALRAAGVDPTARGETLDVTAFARIASAAAGRGARAR